MSKSFKARLVTDVSFVDFYGRKVVRPAGELVEVIQVRGDTVAATEGTRTVIERPLSYIASVGDLSFDVQQTDFQVDA